MSLIRAALWLAADDLGENDGQARLWLHLADGQVRAFRLPAASFRDDAVLAPLTFCARR
jgi:hypothetical protein